MEPTGSSRDCYLPAIVRICMACSATTPETSGRFCPECGAVLSAEVDANFDPSAATRLGSSDRGAAPRDPGESPSDKAGLVGAKLDGFVIEGVVGGGAFGTVYRAVQLGLDRPVAFKVPTMEIAVDPVMAKRFAREARAAARIQHPGVVAIYAVGELPDSRPYLAMQLLEGEPLDAILKDGPVPVTRALGLARQIASALSETHAAGVVHRDLKPTNIMWRRDRNGDDRLTLVDFGIAVCKPGNADATRLTSGGLIGTPHYMSPEQAHGEMVDARADIYALGCLLFELITATTPFEGSGFEVLLAHLGRPPPRPSDRNPDIPEVVDQLVLAMMAKKPDERVPTADAVVELIDEALAVFEREPTPPDHPPARPRTKRTTAARTRKDRPALPRPATTVTLATAMQAAADTFVPPRPARLRWMAAGALVAVAITGGLYATLLHPKEAASPDTDPRTTRRQVVFRDAGDLRLRVWVPEPFAVGRARLHVEIQNKLGAPVIAEQLIVTIEAPDGEKTGITARPRQDHPEQFGFSYEFSQAGTYQLRVFPPEQAARSPTTFDVPLVVAAR
jgi:serine/threonine protein kinase